MASLFNEDYDLLESGAILYSFTATFQKAVVKTLHFDRKAVLNYDRTGKETITGKAPSRRSSRTGQSERSKGTDTEAYSGGCNIRESISEGLRYGA